MLSEDQSVDLVNDDSSIFIVETPSDLASVTFRGSHIQHHKDPVESEIQYQVSIFHFKKKGKKRNSTEMTSCLRHITQPTGLLKRKFEIQISHHWLICQYCSIFMK